MRPPIILVFAALCLFTIAVVSPVLAADVPSSMQVQGALLTAGGSPVNGSYSLTFRLYTAETGGAPVLTKVVTNVAVVGGVFEATLSLTDAPTLFAQHQTLWLETQTGSDPVLPRQRLHSTPYAFMSRHAQTATSASDVSCSGCVGALDIGPGVIASANLADGSVTSAKAGFNWALGTTKGGAAASLECSGCVDASEVAFNYAASATKGGGASDVSCTGTCVSAGEVDFAYAAGDSKGGAATNLACTTCVQGTEIAAGAVTSAHIADGGIAAADVGFAYAGSATQGGAALDLSCTGCVSGGEIAANPTIAGSLTLSGAIQACTANAAGCSVRVSDDGGFYDMNDAWITARITSGLKVRSPANDAWRAVQAGDGVFAGTVAAGAANLVLDASAGGPSITTTGNTQVTVHSTTGTATLSVDGGVIAGSNSAITGSLAVSGIVTMARRELTAGQIALRQVSVEGDTRIFSDYGPYHSWGVYHENVTNKVHFTRRDGAGFQQWSEAGPEGTTTTTSVAQVDLDDGSAYFNGNLGVGTAAPTAKLHVTGDARIEGNLIVNGIVTQGAAPTQLMMEGWDAVLRSRYSGYDYDLIGTYWGWDKNAVYVAGYGQGNSATSDVQRVWIGGTGSNIDLHVTGAFYGEARGACDCYHQNVVGTFDAQNQWGTCDYPNGYFMTGMHISCTHSTYCIEYLHCCRPCNFRSSL